jgi:hypothetical protein
MVESIRVKLASGLYSKADCWKLVHTTMSWQEFDDIAEYRTFPEIRNDLKVRIEELPQAIKLFEDYQDALRHEVKRCDSFETSSNKQYPFEEKKEQLFNKLRGDLEQFSTIRAEELKKFLQI